MYTSELQHAADILKRGGIVAYATEYCFGLGCDPFNRNAVLRLLRLKHRSVKKGLIVLAADAGQLAPYLNDIPAQVAASWPGPHTWLLSRRPGVPAWITGRHGHCLDQCESFRRITGTHRPRNSTALRHVGGLHSARPCRRGAGPDADPRRRNGQTDTNRVICSSDARTG